MNWEQLLNTNRLGDALPIPYPYEETATEFENDYWRITSNAAFRRLQDKTQVFPLDKSDYVRTRLTHSLEVSSLARQLVSMIYKNLKNNTRLKARFEKYPFNDNQAKDAAEVVACAALVHDIGNPPFGHFGEDILKNWYQNQYDTVNVSKKGFEKDLSTKETFNWGKSAIESLAEEHVQDLINFEGNAQAFRLLAKLQCMDSVHGLNLTCAVLSTIVKYPTDSMHIEGKKSKNICKHKLGFYQAEKELFEDIAKETGTIFDGAYHRHPLAYVLEAADDIAYATADLEDSYKKGLFSAGDLYDFLYAESSKIAVESQKDKTLELIQKLKCLNIDHSEKDKIQLFQQWISYTRYWLLYTAAYGFTSNYERIMSGAYHDELITGTYHEATMNILKKRFMPKYVYNNHEIVKLELSAQTILEGLLRRFTEASLRIDTPDQQTPTHKKLLSLISESQKEVYCRSRTEDPSFNRYLQLLLVNDFISGMTDSYAKTLYQELAGIC